MYSSDATAEMTPRVGIFGIYSDMPTNHGNYGSWNIGDITTSCVGQKSMMSQGLSVARLPGVTWCCQAGCLVT